MATMTARQVDAMWAAIDEQRVRTADLLDGLEPDQWEQASLCEGWTVRDVGAHLTMQQQRWRDALAFVARHPRLVRSRGLNGFIHDATVTRAGELTTAQIVERIRSGIGSRRHNPVVTPLETATDILVHGQDIAVPLGIGLPMHTSLSALAATRRWDTRQTWLATVNTRLPLEDHRLTATDTDWVRGSGPEVAGPIGALLLVLTGRAAALGQLTGPGVDALHRAVTPTTTQGI